MSNRKFEIAIAAILGTVAIFLCVALIFKLDELDNAYEIIRIQNELIQELELKTIPEFQFEPCITVTAYTSLARLTDKTPWITASGEKCSPRTLAVSRDLLSNYTVGAKFAYGDTAYIILGPYRIEDTMNKRKKNCVDIWMPSLACAESFGIEKDAILVVVEG